MLVGHIFAIGNIHNVSAKTDEAVVSCSSVNCLTKLKPVQAKAIPKQSWDSTLTVNTKYAAFY